jgi:hypothetical protein
MKCVFKEWKQDIMLKSISFKNHGVDYDNETAQEQVLHPKKSKYVKRKTMKE